MATNVVGLFESWDKAQRVVRDLVDSGVSRDDISIVASDAAGTLAQREVGGTQAAEGAASGAVGGGMVGGVLGLLVGLGALAIPGVGPVIAAGPLAAALGSAGAGALVGAGAGAATGGLLGGLVGLGIPDEDAEVYAEGIRRGGALVAVNTPDDRVDSVAMAMQQHDVIDIDERASQWRRSGWTGFDTSAPPYTSHEIDTFRSGGAVDPSVAGMPGAPATMDVHRGGDFSAFDSDYRTHFAGLGASTYTYDQYEPVYRYGYDLANDRRYAGREWADVEADARRSWEERNPNSWEDFKDSVRYAWERARR